jgi:hypothetical protein
MMDFVFEFLKPLKIVVLLTFLFAVTILQWQNTTHRYVLKILAVCILTELINSALIVNAKSIVLCYTLSIVIHHSLWLSLLSRFVTFPKTAYLFFLGFTGFAIVNLFFIEGTDKFNYFTFVAGAFLYIGLFIYESFSQLKKENFPFFLSNDYVVLLAPVFFFFGLSFMFGFKSKEITSFLIFGDVKLYTFIAYFVNIVYYTLLNIYIYREKRLQHV